VHVSPAATESPTTQKIHYRITCSSLFRCFDSIGVTVNQRALPERSNQQDRNKDRLSSV